MYLSTFQASAGFGNLFLQLKPPRYRPDTTEPRGEQPVVHMQISRTTHHRQIKICSSRLDASPPKRACRVRGRTIHAAGVTTDGATGAGAP